MDVHLGHAELTSAIQMWLEVQHQARLTSVKFYSVESPEGWRPAAMAHVPSEEEEGTFLWTMDEVLAAWDQEWEEGDDESFEDDDDGGRGQSEDTV